MPGYLLRAGYEEMRILCRREPIERLLAGDEVTPAVRAKLELTLAVRDFAAGPLGLDVGGSYTSVSRIDDDQIVHLVTAAPRDRLEAYTWWFPIVGRVPYRSYFDAADARALADALEREHYDTWVRPAVAFSTLGWFDDPLLSNLLAYDEVDLADIILHELLHNTIYLPSQAAFNESFATFVGRRGALAFFTARGDVARAARAAGVWADELAFSDFLGGLVSELAAAYARGISLEQRAALLRAAQARWARTTRHSDHHAGFATMTLNNAVLIHYRLYADRLALFARVLAHHEGDLARTIVAIRAAVRGQADPFGALERIGVPAPLMADAG